MAEAHQAVAFSFSVTHEGFDISYDREVLNLVWESGIRSWRNILRRFWNSISNGLYPTRVSHLLGIIPVTSAIHFYGNDTTFDLAKRILPHLPGETTGWRIVACSAAGVTYWLCISFVTRKTLNMLFMYKGWMYETRERGGRVSIPTRLWAGATKILLCLNKPSLYSFQQSLPRLPLPSLHNTLARYLESDRAILNDDEFKHMQELAKEFERTIGPKLQRYLKLKSWWSSNYVSDWWEEFVYLRGRSPLMTISNFYGTDALLLSNTTIQTARAAVTINLLLKFRRSVDRQQLQPIMVQGLVPLCSWQYERIFNTVRIPGLETDRLFHFRNERSNHIVVMHKGRYYKVIIYYKGGILSAPEIQVQLDEVVNSKSEPLPGEELLASFTAWNRTKWAEVRNSLFNKGVNRASLQIIDTAAFVVSLDDEAYETDIQKEGALDHLGKSLLHGNGHNRWFDKSFTLCVGSNGRLGFNAEHTWADAPIMAHMWESNIADEVNEHPYDELGNCKGPINVKPPSPQRMSWDLDNEACLSKINEAHEDAQKLLNDLQLRVYVHNNYGKGFMKKCHVSPDAYVQMALQLAYYRDAGRFTCTYEASMTRLFLEGRTETVRPCTIESVAWVKSMDDGKSTTEQRVELLQKACKRHQRGYQDAMCGKGFDRHLFCLYVVSKYLEVDSPFLNEVLSEPWRLSTSQTPQSQTNKLDLRTHPECISAGGGFGPVADDGYGVSYIIVGEDLLFFHISALYSCELTDAIRFSKNIEKSLADIKNLFEEYQSLQKLSSSAAK